MRREKEAFELAGWLDMALAASNVLQLLCRKCVKPVKNIDN
jgi:hypothetical protein